ncbi:MAG: exodeoxyribonuclease VII small subunit [Holosporales bacterium]|jgi:exodeoxyribonuclease VII small subunit|nr:exodeoxyribonuclease VII small subunit [Holosporales bacterium]
MEPETRDESSFELALAGLEEVVKKLEEGRVSLEEAVALYEKGSHLRKCCAEKLQKAQMKIDKIVEQEAAAPTPPEGDVPSLPLE